MDRWTCLAMSLLFLASAGCAASRDSSSVSSSSGSELAGTETATVEPSEAGPAPQGPPVGPNQIARASLVPVLEGGLGRFLGTVDVRPVLEGGVFVGFRIVALRGPDGRYDGVDLAPGDVVTRVNGSPIERPEQALEVFRALEVVSELCIEYLRNGERREIRYAIVD